MGFENGLRLGKTEARDDAVLLKMASYVDLKTLDNPPSNFGHENLVHTWPMLGNDKYGNCVPVGGMHQIQLYNRQAGRTISMSTKAAVQNYRAISGFDPTDPSTDRGCDMEYAARYWRQSGLADSKGVKHHIAAYTALKPGNVGQLTTACWLFSAVGIGIRFPNYAMDLFMRGEPWDLPPKGADTNVQGGHYIPAVAFRDDWIYVVTWGKLHRMSQAFYREYCDEAIVHFSIEMLIRGKTLNGFDTDSLNEDLRSVTHLK